MVKRKRLKRATVYGVIEGEKAEANFLTVLKEIYLDKKSTSFNEHPSYGGNPDRLVAIALKNIFYDKVFVWIDEDVDLTQETRQSLAKCWNISAEAQNVFLTCPLKDLQRIHNAKQRKPALIVSQPICAESLILRTLGFIPKYTEFNVEQREEQIENLKSSLAGVIGKKNQLEFYREKFSKELLEEKRKIIPELDLLISMITR